MQRPETLSEKKAYKTPGGKAISEPQLVELGEEMVRLGKELLEANTLEARKKSFQKARQMWELLLETLEFTWGEDDVALLVTLDIYHTNAGKDTWLGLVYVFIEWMDTILYSFEPVPSQEILDYLERLMKEEAGIEPQKAKEEFEGGTNVAPRIQ